MCAKGVFSLLECFLGKLSAAQKACFGLFSRKALSHIAFSFLRCFLGKLSAAQNACFGLFS